MVRLTKKLLFAIEAVLDIAYNAGTLPVQSGEITRRQGIPRRYLEQVLQQLVRAGVLTGVRGPPSSRKLLPLATPRKVSRPKLPSLVTPAAPSWAAASCGRCGRSSTRA